MSFWTPCFVLCFLEKFIILSRMFSDIFVSCFPPIFITITIILLEFSNIFPSLNWIPTQSNFYCYVNFRFFPMFMLYNNLNSKQCFSFLRACSSCHSLNWKIEKLLGEEKNFSPINQSMDNLVSIFLGLAIR